MLQMQSTSFRSLNARLSYNYVQSLKPFPRYISPQFTSFHSDAPKHIPSEFRVVHRHSSSSALSKIEEAEYQTFVLQSKSSDPYFNLTVEHYLLQHSHPESRILFLYVNRPCVVIGRNQNPWVECDLRKLRSGFKGLGAGIGEEGTEAEEILLVRRRSGGGAVFHDEGNLNWSVIVPNSVQFEFKRRTHAEMVVRAIEKVRESMIKHHAGTAKGRNVRVNERHDIVMDAVTEGSANEEETTLKVSGSAFKLTKGRAVHHGTLLFASPHLGSIGKLLHSPVKDIITAKGVASVRSAVGSLFSPANSGQLREMLDNGIAAQFKDMYSDADKGEVYAFVSDADANGATKVGKDISKGMEEMKSPEWIFEQTPSFSLSTRLMEGKRDSVQPKNSLKGTDIFLEVRNGIIQHAELDSKGDTQNDESVENVMEDIRSQIEGKKLHEIEWRSLCRGRGQAPSGLRVLFGSLAGLLPPWSKSPLGLSEHTPGIQDIPREKEDQGIVKREHVDGMVELEKKGERIVEEVGG